MRFLLGFVLLEVTLIEHYSFGSLGHYDPAGAACGVGGGHAPGVLWLVLQVSAHFALSFLLIVSSGT